MRHSKVSTGWQPPVKDRGRTERAGPRGAHDAVPSALLGPVGGPVGGFEQDPSPQAARQRRATLQRSRRRRLRCRIQHEGRAEMPCRRRTLKDRVVEDVLLVGALVLAQSLGNTAQGQVERADDPGDVLADGAVEVQRRLGRLSPAIARISRMTASDRMQKPSTINRPQSGGSTASYDLSDRRHRRTPLAPASTLGRLAPTGECVVKMVGAAGFEPARARARGILSPFRLPFRHAPA